MLETASRTSSGTDHSVRVYQLTTTGTKRALLSFGPHHTTIQFR
uniref:Uncharacterized protein n=1 Tax=Aegilops tauschii subsp. strangulata TaxID=200361 RepID=A0A453Q4K9_AEGTS